MPHLIFTLSKVSSISFSKNQLTFDQIIEHFSHNSQKSTVGTSEGNVQLETIRKSQFSNFEGIKITPDPSYDFNLKSIYHNTFDFFKLDDTVLREWTLISYNIGDKFEFHTDSPKHSSHVGTLLLFPPANQSFTGGDLILSVGNETIVIQPSKFTKWTIVAFTLDVIHCCTPIFSGTRYVFKTRIEDISILHRFKNTEKQSLLSLTDIYDAKINKHQSSIKALNSEIKYLKSQIKNLRQKVNDCRNNKCSSDLNALIQNIIDSPKNEIILLLRHFYNDNDPTQLIGKDRIIWNEIISRYPFSHLQTLLCKAKQGSYSNYERESVYNGFDDDTDYSYHYPNDNKESCYPDKLTFPDIYDDYGDQICDIMFVTTKYKIGEFKNETSEYNDEGYDIIYNYQVSAIFIQKT